MQKPSSDVKEARERLDVALLRGEAELSCEYEDADRAVYAAARELLILLDATDQANEGRCQAIRCECDYRKTPCAKFNPIRPSSRCWGCGRCEDCHAPAAKEKGGEK